MIFITVGTQKFNFNRLLKEIERLKKEKKISVTVIAQIGLSNFKTDVFETHKFLTPELFEQYVENSNLVISHGGTGAITNVLVKNKSLIVVPRLKKFKEHVDDHQLEITNLFEKRGYIIPCYQIEKLEQLIIDYKSFKLNTYIQKPNELIVKILHDFVLNNF